MSGKLIIVSAPSGAGKTTIVKELMRSRKDLEFSVSACSRPRREGEKEGRDYYFMSTETFREKIRKGEFIEWEEVYEDQYYGTLRSEVERILSEGRNIIFDVDVKGGISIKKLFGDQALSIFIMPPSIEVLEERLSKRGTEDGNGLKKRLSKAADEITYAGRFDVIIVNEVLSVAVELVVKVANRFLENQSE